MSAKTQPNCVTYGNCGDSEDGVLDTSCVGKQPPQKLPEDYVSILNAFCPELLTQYGDELCCDGDQVLSISDKLGLASTFISKCPSCFRNIRQTICNLMCSPEQYKFLDVTKVAVNNGTGEEKEYVAKADVYIMDHYAQSTFASCENVVSGMTNGPIFDFFCGKWKKAGCNYIRWFEFVGRASTGVLSIDANFFFTHPGESYKAGMQPFDFNTTKCSEPANVSLINKFFLFHVV